MNSETVSTEGFFANLKQRFNNWRDDRRERKSFLSTEEIIKTYGNTVWVHRQHLNNHPIRAVDLAGLIDITEDGHFDLEASISNAFKQVQIIDDYADKVKATFLENALEVERILRRHLSFTTESSLPYDVDQTVSELKRVGSPLKNAQFKVNLPYRPKLVHHFLAGEQSDRFFDQVGIPLVGTFEGMVIDNLPALDKPQFELLAEGTNRAALAYRQLAINVRRWHTPSDDESIYVKQVQDLYNRLNDAVTDLRSKDPQALDPMIQNQIDALRRRRGAIASAQYSLEHALQNVQYWTVREQLLLLAYAPITALGRILYRSTTTHVR